ncbi:NAD(P)H-hydrate dehydratase [Knoellia sp. p5-6-4]|uniref:NAD(P)H-hydrate dehydratase n=1 Tax=unclassified Knoellia TaxID=2618719 RepID=UPI0023DCA4A4|nr:NAD(P)H-hydrate dehydratase [Knoellia sp. p5-6-4]MDF2145326.1 NAD(P)H-hydrate dehydratase [Knoellia sp. p5-6-4]
MPADRTTTAAVDSTDDSTDAGVDAAVDVTAGLLRRWPLPEPGKDKESRGRVLVLGGTASTPGAVLLAGEAALRAGGGKLQIATAEPVASALAVAAPESLVAPLPTDRGGNIDPGAADEVLCLSDGCDALLVGPGFSDVDASVHLLEHLLPQLTCPVVVDALGSAYVTAHRDGLAHLGGRAVLTLNPDELAKTLGIEAGEVEDGPAAAALRLAREATAVVVCGGQGKTVAAPDGRLWTSSSGNPGLGVSGSGDVQAGIVAGLLSRGAEPEQAAVWGGHLHGSAGDRLAKEVGTLGFLAREIAGCVPRLLDELSP